MAIEAIPVTAQPVLEPGALISLQRQYDRKVTDRAAFLHAVDHPAADFERKRSILLPTAQRRVLFKVYAPTVRRPEMIIEPREAGPHTLHTAPSGARCATGVPRDSPLVRGGR